MDSTPTRHQSEPPNRTKSASRLSKLRHYCEEESGSEPIPKFSLEIVPSSPTISTASPKITKPPYTLPLHELLLLSPSSPLKKSKTRLRERLEIGDDAAVEACGVRKRCKSSRNAASSPRSSRRSRRRVEQEIREDRELVLGEEILVKPRKKRHSERSRKDKSISDLTLRESEGDGFNLKVIGEILNDLVMWKDVSKSSFWFGFGSLCFLSSCFAKGVNFSIFSLLSQLGLLLLGVSFFSNSVRAKDATEITREFKLKEDDILRVARLVLPAANLAISKAREVFSGEPGMTLKVIPVLVVGAEYGHLITLWRLCAVGFFISFIGPRLYSAYSAQLSKKVEYLKSWALSAWGRCTHKKIVAGSVLTAFWNLTSIRTRMVAAFLCLVILRYRKLHSGANVEEEGKLEHQEKALVAVEIESKK